MPHPFAAFAATLALAGAIALAQKPAPARFTDVAPASHLTYRTNNGFTGRKYFPQPLCGGVAVLDFDQDGAMDIFFANGARFPDLVKAGPSYFNSLLRNKGNGTFEDVTARAGVAGEQLGFSIGAAAGDFDNDGFPDLFVTSVGRNTLYRNNGDGTFKDVTAASGLDTKPARTLSVHAAWFDFDNDGRLDLAVADYVIWTAGEDKRCLRGETEMYCTPKTYASVPQRLYRNLGGGRFEDVTVRSGFGAVPGKGMGIAIADVNQDGTPDVFVANDTERNLLFLNRGNGTFREAGLLWGVAYNDSGATVSAMGADARDVNNDGWPDIFYNNLMGQTWALFLNRSGKLFEYASPATGVLQLSQPYSGWSAGFVDFDNDGWKDLYSANGDVDNLVPNAAQHDTMFRNNGGAGKSFSDVSSQMGAAFLRIGYQRGAAFADLNNDGFQDIVVTSLGQPPRILFNSAEGGGHWLLVDPVGRGGSNREAIGARMKLTTGSGRLLYNHVTTSVGFMSSSDRRVHFGLGAEHTIATLEVRWPGGAVQTLKNVLVDRILKLEEPPVAAGKAAQ